MTKKFNESFGNSIKTLNDHVKACAEIMSRYYKRKLKNSAERIVQAKNFKPQIIQAYHIAMRDFIEDRFGELAAIGDSPKWEKMKANSYPVRVTRGGSKKPSNPDNSQAFGLASDYLIDQIFQALLSDKGISPGFKMIVKIAADGNPDWSYEIRMDNFYKIKFKRRRVPYPQFLDELLEGTISYSDNPEKYTAYGQFSLGLLGMTPAESEMIDVNAKEVFLRIIAAARSTMGNRR